MFGNQSSFCEGNCLFGSPVAITHAESVIANAITEEVLLAFHGDQDTQETILKNGCRMLFDQLSVMATDPSATIHEPFGVASIDSGVVMTVKKYIDGKGSSSQSVRAAACAVCKYAELNK